MYIHACTFKTRLEFSITMLYAYNRNTQEAEANGSLAFKANLVYRASSGTARSTQRNPVSKN